MGMTDDRDKVVRGKIVHVHASLEKGAHISIRMDPPSTALILGDDVIAFPADSQRYRVVDVETREEALAAIEKAFDMVGALCKPRGTEGARDWIMSIPARPDHDPDIVIADALKKAKDALTAQPTAEEAA